MTTGVTGNPKDILQANDLISTAGPLIWQIRLPRLLLAFMVGIGLSVSGYILQCLTRNCLADPYLTGVSGGAGLAVACALLANLPFAGVPAVAFAGGITASIVVGLLSRSSFGISVTRLLLSGIALSSICGSLTTMLLITCPNPMQAQGIFFWLAGGIAGRSWSELSTCSLYILLGILVSFVMSKQLRLLGLGSQQAASLGSKVQTVQLILLAVASLLCGAAVSVSGMVGFVGLVAPQLSRIMIKSDERFHLLSTAMIGATLVLLADLCARTLGQGQELPLGALLALIGGPFFLWLVVQQKGEAL